MKQQSELAEAARNRAKRMRVVDMDKYVAIRGDVTMRPIVLYRRYNTMDILAQPSNLI